MKRSSDYISECCDYYAGVGGGGGGGKRALRALSRARNNARN